MQKTFFSIIFEEPSMQKFISSLLQNHYGFSNISNDKNTMLEKDGVTVLFAFPKESQDAGNSTMLKNIKKAVIQDYNLSMGYKNIIKLILWDSDGSSETTKLQEVNNNLRNSIAKDISEFYITNRNPTIYHALAHVNLESWLLYILKSHPIQKEVLQSHVKNISKKIQKAEDKNAKQIYTDIVKAEYTHAIKKGDYFGKAVDIKSLRVNSKSFNKFITFLEKAISA